MRWRTFVAGLFAGLVVLALAGPAEAATNLDRDARVILNGGLTLDQGERADAVVVFNGPVVIDGTVTHSVVVFNGTVTVSGRIGENLVVFNGVVTVKDGAFIGGDVATGQAPTIAPGATVGGSVHRVRTKFNFGFAGRFVVWLAYSVSTLGLGFLLILLMPRGLEAASRIARERLGASIGWGFLVFFGLPIGAVILLVTLVGIPLGLAVLLGLFLLYTVGYTVSAWVLGRRILKPTTGRALAFLAGWAILRVVGLIPVIGGLLWFLAAVFGLGALMVAAWRARTGPVLATAAPATVPPMPGGPGPLPPPPG